MAFVKDDHSYTRGPGAIAAMDAASPARRIAAARAERALRLREVLTQGAIETGQEAAFSRPPPPPRPGKGRHPFPRPPHRPLPGKVKLPVRPKGLDVIGGRIDGGKLTVKLPGSVIEPPKTGGASATQTATPTTAPTKGSTVIIGGGSGTSWTAPSSKAGAAMSVDNPPPEFAPEPEEAPAQPAPAAKPASSKVLLYAALGIGAWWLLTRKK